MIVKSLNLLNFRNYANQLIEFSDNYNIIYGENGQGKTNIVESLFFCSSARSHRTSKDIEMIKDGSEFSRIQLLIDKENNNQNIDIILTTNQRKKIKINDIPQKKVGSLMGCLNTILFSPEDLMIIKDGPSGRRKFIDISISQLKPSYFSDLINYARVVQQKNMLLKNIENFKNKSDMIQVWNENMSLYGSKIIKNRSDYVKNLLSYAQENHFKLTGKLEKLNIIYNPSIVCDANSNISEIKEIFLRVLNDIRDNEIRRGVCLVGPQRDDYSFYLNDYNIRIYGSQGQQRTAILSAKLAEIDIVKNDIGENPVLLLDDVMSELDSGRRNYLLQSLTNVQTIITCTDKTIYEGNLTGDSKFFHIKNGKVV